MPSPSAILPSLAPQRVPDALSSGAGSGQAIQPPPSGQSQPCPEITAPGETESRADRLAGRDPSGTLSPSSRPNDGSAQTGCPTAPAGPVSPGAPPSGQEPVRLLTRPRKRADCINGPRPCPWIGCKWHVCWEHKKIKRLLLSNADPREVAALIMAIDETCVLDFADEPQNTGIIGRIFGVSHQAMDQTVDRAMLKLLGKRFVKRFKREFCECDG